MKKQLLRNVCLGFGSVFLVSSLVYGFSGWEGVENASDGETLTHTAWNSLVNGVVKKTGDKHIGGNIYVSENEDITLDIQNDSVLLRFDGDTNTWYTVSRTLHGDLKNSKAENGYTYLPNGILLQWGKLTNVSLNQTFHNVSFPVTFPNAIFNVTATLSRSGNISGTVAPLVRSTSITTSGMEISGDHDTSTSNGDIYWSVIGY